MSGEIIGFSLHCWQKSFTHYYEKKIDHIFLLVFLCANCVKNEEVDYAIVSIETTNSNTGFIELLNSKNEVLKSNGTD